jgi:hypothetical protein
MNATDYKLLLKKLHEKRTKLDQAIAGVEALIALGEFGQTSSPFKFIEEVTDPFSTMGRFQGVSILEGCRVLLQESSKPQTANQLSAALISQGYPASSKNFFNTVAAVLNRCDKTGGNVIRVGKNLFTLVDERKTVTTSNTNNPSFGEDNDRN